MFQLITALDSETINLAVF